MLHQLFCLRLITIRVRLLASSDETFNVSVLATRTQVGRHILFTELEAWYQLLRELCDLIKVFLEEGLLFLRGHVTSEFAQAFEVRNLGVWTVIQKDRIARQFSQSSLALVNVFDTLHYAMERKLNKVYRKLLFAIANNTCECAVRKFLLDQESMLVVLKDLLDGQDAAIRVSYELH